MKFAGLAFITVWIGMGLSSLTIVGFVVYAAVHFIHKVW
jgi:hypothetical protein